MGRGGAQEVGMLFCPDHLNCNLNSHLKFLCLDDDAYTAESEPLTFHLLGDPPGPLSAGRIIGIVIGVLSALFVVGIFGWIYGKPCWDKRHNYGWYNTLTTPSDWCDCDCDCFSSSTSTRAWQSSDNSVCQLHVHVHTHCI